MTRGNPRRSLVVEVAPEYQIPGSNAVFEPSTDNQGDITKAIVRCESCHRRLFDLQVTSEIVGWAWEDVPIEEPRMSFNRRCPKCGADWHHKMTATYGSPVGSDGIVKCPRCAEQRRGGFLARIEEARGRIILSCPKCKADIRVNTPYMYHQLQSLNQRHKEQHRFDDVPF